MKANQTSEQSHRRSFATLVFIYFALSFSFSTFATQEAIDSANAITNTDSNGDGVSDGNVSTLGKDYENKINFSIIVTSANLRGSLEDAECVDGTGETCGTEAYFGAGQVDIQMADLAEIVRVANENQSHISNYQDTSDSSLRTQYSPDRICASIPSTFGCQAQDYELLTTARAALGSSIANGDPVLANGKDPTSFLGTVDAFISKITSIRDDVINGFTGGLNFAGLKGLGSEDGSGMGPENTKLQAAYSYADYQADRVEASKRATFGKENWVGPENLSNMSTRVESYNGLEVADAKTGRDLTLWQRATRRYQSFDLSRAYTLAKTEGARGKHLLSSRAPASANKK